MGGTANACFDAPDPLPILSHGLGDAQSRCSRRSRHSTTSSVSYKREEGLVKVKLANGHVCSGKRAREITHGRKGRGNVRRI